MNTRMNDNAAPWREQAWTSEPELRTDSTLADDPEHTCRVMRELLVREASALLNLAIEAEFESFVGRFAAASDDGGRRAVVRNGYQPAREIMTALGPVSIRLPKVRARGVAAVYRSMLVRPYMRRTHPADEDAAKVFLQALDTGDARAALLAVLGPVAAAFPPGVTRRLDTHWQERHRPWLRGTLVPMRCEWLWFDRVARGAEGRGFDLSLVVVGHDRHAGPQLLALRAGHDSTRSWTEVVQHLRNRGLRPGFRWGRAATVAGDIEAAIGSVYRQTGFRDL